MATNNQKANIRIQAIHTSNLIFTIISRRASPRVAGGLMVGCGRVSSGRGKASREGASGRAGC